MRNTRSNWNYCVTYYLYRLDKYLQKKAKFPERPQFQNEDLNPPKCENGIAETPCR